MSNLPAPFDPNLLPAIQHAASQPYSQRIFLAQLEVLEVEGLPDAPTLHVTSPPDQPSRLELFDQEHGKSVGYLDPERSQILVRLLEAGKHLVAESVYSDPPSVRISLQEL